MSYLRLSRLILSAFVAAAGCSPDGGTGGNGDGDGGRRDGDDAGDIREAADGDGAESSVCDPGEVLCFGSEARTCNGDGTGWASAVACSAPTAACTDGVGCTVCAGGEGVCEGDVARLCVPDGSGWYADDTCDTGAGERCVGGYCTDMTGPCEEARLDNSYEGCDFFVSVTANSVLMDPVTFKFAIVVGNRNPGDAAVRVTNGAGDEIGAATVPSNTAVNIDLPWQDELRSPFGSRLVGDGAYRVRSDVPVTVYQFNPLKYWGSPNPLLPGSYSNDASLVLPRNVLTGRYVGVGRETFYFVEIDDEGREIPSWAPGFLAVVGTRDGTSVTITFSAHAQGAGTPAHDPGDTATFSLDESDVLELLTELPPECSGTNWGYHPARGTQLHYCEVGPEYDLTGTVIRSDKPVAVIGGVDCTFVPHDRWACDHLEEMLFPVEAWGTRYAATRPQQIADEGTIWRVMSAVDGNAITFTPPAVHPPATLGSNEWMEFESTADFLVDGTGPLLVTQYLVGQGSDLDSIGDPAMGLAVPIGQYRTEYDFLAPADYVDVPGTDQQGHNYVNVIAPDGVVVTLDGRPVTDYSPFDPIGSTGYGVARVEIAGGSHSIGGTGKFGIMCYGYGNYDSYMYPGGLNVDPINTVVLW